MMQFPAEDKYPSKVVIRPSSGREKQEGDCTSVTIMGQYSMIGISFAFGLL